MKIAIYKRMGDVEYETVREVKDWMENSPDYLRITEPAEVTFTSLSAEDLLQPQLDALDAREKEERARHTAAMALIDDARGKLLAITHNPDK